MAINYNKEIKWQVIFWITMFQKQGGRVSYIFCGDFNSTPDWGVYMLITTQHIPVDCIDWTSSKLD
jgi:hypothetical protein